MTERTFGDRLLEGAYDALAIAEGRKEAPRSFVPSPIDVKAMRERMNLSQEALAAKLDLPVGIVRDWEVGRIAPDAAARSLLLIAEREPEAVDRALAG